jgi:hypothetical protein
MSVLDEFIPRTDWPHLLPVQDAGWIFDPDIIEGLPDWSWEDSTGQYSTRICLEQENGTVYWEVWKGEICMAVRPLGIHGVKAALHMVVELRTNGSDERGIRRVRAGESL